MILEGKKQRDFVEFYRIIFVEISTLKTENLYLNLFTREHKAFYHSKRF